MNEKLYQEELMEHFKHPRNKKKLKNPDFSSGRNNPSCGDSILVEGNIEKDPEGNLKIKEIAFDGSGCVISMATASMLMQKCKGKTVEQVKKITKDDILEMIGIKLGPVRLKCALLCLDALQSSLEKFK